MRGPSSAARFRSSGPTAIKGVPNFGFPNIKSWVGLSAWPAFCGAPAWSTRAAIPMPRVLSASDSRSSVFATECGLFFATISPAQAREGIMTMTAISARNLVKASLLVVRSPESRGENVSASDADNRSPIQQIASYPCGHCSEDEYGAHLPDKNHHTRILWMK
jgi:hypothetical protein